MRRGCPDVCGNPLAVPLKRGMQWERRWRDAYGHDRTEGKLAQVVTVQDQFPKSKIAPRPNWSAVSGSCRNRRRLRLHENFDFIPCMYVCACILAMRFDITAPIAILHHRRTNILPGKVLNPIQARLFWSSCGQGGHIVPPLENHVPLVLTAYCKVSLKACPKLDHMTHFGFHGNCFRCF